MTGFGIAAVILAAGESTRLGQPKQLLQFHGKTLLRRAFDAASEAACQPILVVVASSQTEWFAAINSELNNTDAKVIANANWKRGIGTSIRAGVEHLIEVAPGVEGTVLLACDQPFVDSTMISRLIALRRETGKPIVASSYGGSLGVPVLFDRAYLPELVELDERSGAKPIILSNRERVAELPFPNGNIDIDTKEDWQRTVRIESSSLRLRLRWQKRFSDLDLARLRTTQRIVEGEIWTCVDKRIIS